jgi:hypothetical protein
VVELKELAQEGFLGAAKQGHIGTVLGATEHGTEGDYQDFVECVPRVILARVLQFGKAGGKPFHGASRGEPHGSNRFRVRFATGILAAMSNAIPLCGSCLSVPRSDHLRRSARTGAGTLITD